MEMTYEVLLEKLQNAKMTAGHVMKLQKHLAKNKALSKQMTDEELAKLPEEEQMAYMEELMDGTFTALYIAIGSPKDMTSEDIAYLIPMDKMEEVSDALTAWMNKMGAAKN